MTRSQLTRVSAIKIAQATKAAEYGPSPPLRCSDVKWCAHSVSGTMTREHERGERQRQTNSLASDLPAARAQEVDERRERDAGADERRGSFRVHRTDGDDVETHAGRRTDPAGIARAECSESLGEAGPREDEDGPRAEHEQRSGP
jgi:hypothetical protein